MHVTSEVKIPQQQAINRKFECKKSGYVCISSYLKNVTITSGPTVALEKLELLLKKGAISKDIDTHALAHTIGRQTAEHFGSNSNSFLMCPMFLFIGGCQHGFFQYVLGKGKSTVESANKLCQNIEEDKKTQKLTSLCYHGIGHGLTMMYEYDLKKAIGVCDKLNPGSARFNCWLGAYMEILNSEANGFINSEYFSKTDPYKPCDMFDGRRSYACFTYIPYYLLSFYKGSVIHAVHSCQYAPKQKSREACSIGFGVLFSLPHWLQEKNDSTKNVPKEAIKKCQLFNKSRLRGFCWEGALRNLFNANYPHVKDNAIYFCKNTPDYYQKQCFESIIFQIQIQTNSSKERLYQCQSLPLRYNLHCIIASANMKWLALLYFKFATSHNLYLIEDTVYNMLIAN